MEHTKKMILIDPRMMSSVLSSSTTSVPSGPPVPDATSSSVRGLDQEMREMLDREDLAVEEKAKAYQQILRQYLHRVGQYRDKPLGVVEIKKEKRGPVEVTGEDKAPASESVSVIEQEVVTSVPKSMKKKS